MFEFFRKKRPVPTGGGASGGRESTTVVLRDESRPGDSRRLSARYATNGDLLIEGQDIGKSVEAFFGSSEYEWAWTIAKSDHPKLLNALAAKDGLLSELKARFSGDDAALLEGFLQEKGVPYVFWSRSGD